MSGMFDAYVAGKNISTKDIDIVVNCDRDMSSELKSKPIGLFVAADVQKVKYDRPF